MDTDKILIVDDDPGIRKIYGRIVTTLGVEPAYAENGAEALDRINVEHFKLAIVDLKMPVMGGLELIKAIRYSGNMLPIMVVTGFGSIESAVESIKLGAIDYLTKPTGIKELTSRLENILAGIDRVEEKATEFETDMYGIVGQAPQMVNVYRMIQQVAPVDGPVIILGESGTGKELVARAIHEAGPRKDEPFLPIDCSALSPSVVESEFFGHVKGAFTDAHHDRDGLLKLAGQGTLFLDEITEISAGIQVKLLRVLQEREFRPVGSGVIERLEARILSASNRNLDEAVSQGVFREDLFYRLHVFPITVPPLRERKSDIPLLVDHFMDKYRSGRSSAQRIATSTMEILIAHGWPGNVRELENCMQRAIALSAEREIRPSALPDSICRKTEGSIKTKTKVRPLKEIEKEAIRLALEEAGGNKRKAAQLLGIGKTTLYEKLRAYQITD